MAREIKGTIYIPKEGSIDLAVKKDFVTTVKVNCEDIIVGRSKPGCLNGLPILNIQPVIRRFVCENE